MANPQIPQGTLNKARGSVFIRELPALNVTVPFLGEDGINVAFDGNTTNYIRTATGAVTSPEPYQMVTITINLLRSQVLAELYKQRVQTNALLGDIVVNTDSSVHTPYQYTNCAIMSVRDLTINGRDAGYVVSIGGIYNINANMFNVL